MQGWVKLYRQILDNPIVCKDSDYFAIWGYLILNATHQERQVLFAGKKISLKNGQLITGRKVISTQFNISESKVQRVLKTFKNEQQIEQQTSNKNRLITILNWEKYQSSEQQDEQQLNNNRTTSEQQVNTNKNVKNIENVKNDNIIVENKLSAKQEKENINNFFETVWKLYPRKRGKSAVSFTKKKELYNFGLVAITKAIDAYKDETKDKEEQFILNGSTFFGGRYKDFIVEIDAKEKEEETKKAEEEEEY